MKGLEKIANLALILAAGAVIAGTLYDRLPIHNSSSVQPAHPMAERLLNKPFTLPSGVAGGKATTLLLFVSKSCHFCSESMPFYERLATMERGSPELAIIGLVPSERETRADGLNYFGEHNIALSAVEAVPFQKLPVPSTPTIVVLDASGVARAIWVGRLTPDRENEVIAKIHRLCETCKGL
jgi:hypothetical protein